MCCSRRHSIIGIIELNRYRYTTIHWNVLYVLYSVESRTSAFPISPHFDETEHFFLQSRLFILTTPNTLSRYRHYIRNTPHELIRFFVFIQEYVLRVQRGVFKENSWYVLRRYNDFLALHDLLQISGICLPLPAKRIFGKFQYKKNLIRFFGSMHCL